MQQYWSNDGAHAWCSSFALRAEVKTAVSLQAAPQRRIYRRIKRGSQPSKGQAAAPAPPQPGNKPAPNCSGPTLTPAAAEGTRLRPPSTRLHAEVKPMPDFSTFPVFDIRPSVMAEHGTDEPVLLTEESSVGSRVNSKKRSAPTTLVNTPQMLQQLAKEGSTEDSICTSSDSSDSPSNDDSDDSEPDVVARHQHPFGTQNGLSNKPQHPLHASSSTAQKGMPMLMPYAHSQGNPSFPGMPRVVATAPAVASHARPAQIQQAGSYPHPVKGNHSLGPKGSNLAGKGGQATGHAAKERPANGDVNHDHAKVPPSGRQMLDMVDTFGRAPLHVAAAIGRVDIVQQLLFGGCDWTKSLQADYRQGLLGLWCMQL